MLKQPAPQKKRAFIYTRVSTNAQAIDGLSLETQRSRCMEWLNKNPEYELRHVFVDAGITGTKDKRRELTNMRKVVRKDDVIILYSLHRLARKLSIWIALAEEMKKKEVRVICVCENIDTNNKQSELISNLIAVLAQHEVEQIRERTVHNLTEKKKRGELCNGKPQYGYGAYKGLNGILYSYPILAEQKGIDVILRHRDAGMSWNKIKTYLSERGFKTKNDVLLWSISVLEKIYKREKINREKNPILLDDEKISKYEKHRVPHVIPEDRVDKFLVNGREFNHEEYNNYYNPGANYEFNNYFPSVQQFKSDIANGYYPADEKTKLLVCNDFDEEKCKEMQDPLIAKVLADPKTKGLYLKGSVNMENIEMKKSYAQDLVESFGL